MGQQNRRLRGAAVLGLVAGLAGVATTAHATWSIILVDVRTGEVAVGCATCLTNRDLQQTTPILLTGIGGGAAQSFVDGTGQNRIFLRDGLVLGNVPSSIITSLATFDGTGHQTRQYGIVDAQSRFTTFTGTGAGKWAGGRTGTFTTTYLGKTSTIAYAIQGNVLTGAPVVDSAVAAARDTAGDLPAKLMAAMEAARSFGGDGRCSCDEGAADSCGSPPAVFTKSAHVGYVLSARAGDIDYSHGIYRTDSNSQALAVSDVNGDGRPDIVTGSISSNVLNILKNATPPGLGFAVFNQQVRTASGGAVRGVAAADFNRDARGDVVVAGGNFNRVSLHRGSADGNLSSRSDLTTNTLPAAICAADFDGVNGPEFAVANVTSADVIVRYNTGTSAMGAATTYPGNPDQRGIIAANVAGDSKPDVIVVSAGATTGPKLAILRSNGVNFTAMPDVVVPANPLSVVAGDFDRDGLVDLAVLHGAPTPSVTILRSLGEATFAATTRSLPTACADLAVGDVDRNGTLDLVVTRNDQQLQVLPGDGAGAFALGPVSLVGQTLNRVVLADFNGDGLLDAAATTGTNGAVVVVGGRPDGSFWSGLGAAMGDYFLEINYPDGNESTPDPVEVLRGRFDTWRSGLVGKVDAVQSDVEMPLVFSGSTASARVVLRDWQGAVVPAGAGGVSLTASVAPRAGGGAAAVSVSAVNIEGDAFIVQLAGLAGEGADALVLRVQQGSGRDIQLMPRPIVRVVPCPADFDGSGGTADISDIDVFAQAWLAGNASADVDRSGGTPDAGDLQLFFDTWLAGGC